MTATGKRDNVSPRARWKVSDIVRASLGAALGNLVANWCALPRREVDVLRLALDKLNITLPRACGVHPDRWDAMSHAQRCDALVATAKRLGVPRNA